MRESARTFIRYALRIDALELVPEGRTLRSGRISSYFFNAGLFNTGESLFQLANAYASAILSDPKDIFLGAPYDTIVLFGPAYKGIPIAASIAMVLHRIHGLNVGYAFNRKEDKDHGEGGRLIGYPLNGAGVIIVDDVITTGASSGEAFHIVSEQGGNPIGCVIAFDRQERGTDSMYSAVETFQQEYGIRVTAAATLNDLITVLRENTTTIPNGPETLPKILEYRERYGA